MKGLRPPWGGEGEKPNQLSPKAHSTIRSKRKQEVKKGGREGGEEVRKCRERGQTPLEIGFTGEPSKGGKGEKPNPKSHNVIKVT